MTEKKLH